MMNRQLKNPYLYLMVLADAALLLLAHFSAYLLRFEFSLEPPQWAQFHTGWFWIIILKLVCFYFFGLYRGMWRYTSLVDLKKVFIAAVASSLMVTACVAFLFQFQGFPRSAFLIDFVLTLLFIGGIRVGVRMVLNPGSVMAEGILGSDKNRKRIMVLGAGFTGEKVVREILDSPTMEMKPVAFLDDDRNKYGKSIHGVPVKGGIGEIGKFEDEFDEILIAIPSVKGEQMRGILSACEKTGKRFRIMPNLTELIDGRISVKAMRDVKFEDLLGREEVRLDAELLNRTYRDKRILVTGAGGSIGSELIRQLNRYHPSALALLDFSEYNLFQIEMATGRQFEHIPVCAYLVDIRNEENLRRVFAEFKPEVVFHAAAYKHVPLQELNPWEAVLNNIRGTQNLVTIAKETGVERFVLVSTDKAVRPTNIMGATKRVAEMFVECVNGGSRCRFVAVRFGNVLGSSGSVSPIFEEQIAARMPVTVTHPEVTRFFMSTAEAAQLILQAGSMGEGGEIFVLDMGRPVKIADMARDLIRLHGLEPETDIPLRIVGLRPGEKLYEELITEGEGIVPTTHEKIRVLRGRHCEFVLLNEKIDALVQAALSYDAHLIKSRLKTIVPEYTPQ
jgi:FlaA1/EpsC-like NDP-sugar epimerase